MDIEKFLQTRHKMAMQELTKYTSSRREVRASVVIGLLLVLAAALLLVVATRPPRDFPVDEIVSIQEGATLGEIADLFHENSLVRSEGALQFAAKLQGNASKIQAGDYAFEKRLGVFALGKRLAEGSFGDSYTRLTIIEGSSLDEIGTVASRELDDFKKDYFVELALDYNGYLFPETYFVAPSLDEQGLIDVMHDQFSDVLTEVAPQRIVDIEPGELRDIVIMASIIEREAAGADDAYMISGILWKRIEEGIPLQVDASFAYLFNKESSEVTQSDLAYDSPYNTYTNKGLPPGPLGNPGKIALDAAFHPAASPYLFYLHDPQGNVHYGRNFTEHKKNKREYLN